MTEATDSTMRATPVDGPASSRKLNFGQLCLFALPALPAAAMSFPLSAYLPPYYASATGLSLGTVGLIFMLARFWDILIDPVMGALSDRTRSPIGRRRPWLLASLPVLGLGAWALFFPPGGAGAAWLLVSLFVAFVGFTMLTITHYAWAADASDDYHDRSRLQGAIVISGIVGTLCALILPALVEQGAADPMQARIEAMGLFALALLVPCILLSVWATPETRAQELPPAASKPLLETIRTALSSSPFRKILLADFTQGIAGGLLLSTFVFFAAAWLDLGDRAGLLLLAFFASGVLFVPGWVVISRHIGKENAVALSSALTIPVIAAFFFIPKGSLAAALTVQALFGSTMGVWIFLTRSLIADIVETEAERTGDSAGGTYYAFATLTTKLGQAVAVGVGYAGLSAVGITPQTLSGEHGLLTAIFTLVPPIVGHFVMIWVMLSLKRGSQANA